MSEEEKEITVLSETEEALEEMQTFDVERLPREAELGQKFSFRPAVEPAKKLIDLYKRLSLSSLSDVPDTNLTQIKTACLRDREQFGDMLSFDPTRTDAVTARNALLGQIESAYEKAFNVLHAHISYSLHRSADFQRLEADARATLKAIREEADLVMIDLNKAKKETADIIKDVRELAAEQGVTQQATYFRDSAKSHEDKADTWRNWTIGTAIGLALYAAGTVLLHKWPYLAPANVYETVQLAISKILVFTVISYVLYLSARNFLSHTHNAIVDRHRQNALLTYKALIDAAGDTPNREVILVQAAACIFGPQGTGYTRDSTPRPPGAHSVVEFMGRTLKSSDS